MTLVKICGMTEPADARHAVQVGADFLGLIFAASPRRVDPEAAARIRDATLGGPPRVGVFVNPEHGFVREAVDAGGLDLVQLHGDETPEFCAAIQVPVIKTLRVGRDAVAVSIAHYAVDYFLLDTYDARLAGGTGRPFDWESAREWAQRTRLFLAGGLHPDNVAAAVRSVGPFAVDVASGVEATPGRKDPARVVAFINAVRAADTSRREES